MNIIEKIEQPIDFIYSLIPFGISLFFFVVFVWFSYYLLIGRNKHLGNEKLFSRQLIIMALVLIAVIGVVLSLPVNESSRNQIIGLIGLVVSGILALSSSTVFANLMAGILLRVTKPFRIGDFIHVQEHFGRVAERGLFDTEIQSENRELIALPNSYLISNAITTTQNTGAIVSSSLSLGYDEHYKDIEILLIKAAEQSGLEDPFVHITSLGDFSISYRVSGLLTESKTLITARSNLNKSILDVLHGRGIEIMSPTFMNQRQLNPATKIIPGQSKIKSKSNSTNAEDIVFDKAEQAEQAISERKLLLDNLNKLETLLKEAPDEEKDGIKTFIEAVKKRLKIIETPLSEQEDMEEEEEGEGNTKENKG